MLDNLSPLFFIVYIFLHFLICQSASFYSSFKASVCAMTLQPLLHRYRKFNQIQSVYFHCHCSAICNRNYICRQPFSVFTLFATDRIFEGSHNKFIIFCPEYDIFNTFLTIRHSSGSGKLGWYSLTGSDVKVG